MRAVDYFINYYSVGGFAMAPDAEKAPLVQVSGVYVCACLSMCLHVCLYAILSVYVVLTHAFQAAKYEANFEGPMSNSAWLAKDVNDKLLTRLLIDSKGVHVPYTVAFATAVWHIAVAARCGVMLDVMC